MAENVADGYRAVGDRRLWGGYGTGGMVIQKLTETRSSTKYLIGKKDKNYFIQDVAVSATRRLTYSTSSIGRTRYN